MGLTQLWILPASSEGGLGEASRGMGQGGSLSWMNHGTVHSCGTGVLIRGLSVLTASRKALQRALNVCGVGSRCWPVSAETGGE